MCLATLEQLETHLLATVMVTPLPPGTGTMMHGQITVLSDLVVLGGIEIAMLQTSMVAIMAELTTVSLME